MRPGPGDGTQTHGAADEAPTHSDPRVTIGLPVYNAERFLDAALESILAQDFEDFELIISDNASTDRTVEICNEHAARDARIRVVTHAQNRGVAANFNVVVDLARGELFRWAAYDDLLAPTLLSRCVDELDQRGSGAVLAYPRTLLIDDEGTVLEAYEDNLDVRHRSPWRRVGSVASHWNLCNPLYGVIRTEALRRTGLQRPFVSADVPLLYELAAHGEFHEVPEPLFLRRFHANSSSGNAGAWYRPDRPGAERFPGVRLVGRSVRVLWGMDQPWATRLACTASFLGAWSYRSARVHAGKYRRAVTGRRA